MIHECLLPGKENAQPGKRLADLLGLDLRQFTKAVEEERRAGFPICASSSGKHAGYYLAKDRREMEVYCHRLEHRAGELDRTREACLAHLDKLAAPEET